MKTAPGAALLLASSLIAAPAAASDAGCPAETDSPLAALSDLFAAASPGWPAWLAAWNPHSVSSRGSMPAGDVDGDGHVDRLVADDRAGRVWIHRGRADGMNRRGATLVIADRPRSGLGAALAPAGDVNGDGYGDVLVSASLHRTEGSDAEGRVYLFLGGPRGLRRPAAWTFDGTRKASGFGDAIASAGDVNGDGYGDILIGEPAGEADGAERWFNDGRAYLFLGGPHGPNASPAWIGRGRREGGWFGSSVASAGDVDGDGYGDVVIGAAEDSDARALDQAAEGRAYLFRGGPRGLAARPSWTMEGNGSNTRFGSAVAGGDFDGDGYSDVAIGAPGAGAGEGEVRIYAGGPNGPSRRPLWVGGRDGHRFAGDALFAPGDLDGDGKHELLVGSLAGADGRASLFRGAPGGLATDPSWRDPRSRAEPDEAPRDDVEGAFGDVGTPYYELVEPPFWPRTTGPSF